MGRLVPGQSTRGWDCAVVLAGLRFSRHFAAAMSIWDQDFAAELSRREAMGQRRVLAASPAQPGDKAQKLINFSANDYLGLAAHPALAERAAEYAARLGTGAGASRLVSGTYDAHLAIEARVAALKGAEAALIMASGWQANAAVLAALLRAPAGGASVFADSLIHASLHHGLRLAGVKPVLFAHNDLADLAQKLAARPPGAAMILTESVFSMDGDRADLPALRALAAAHGAFLYVDEAHATGILGEGGRGLVHAAGGADLVMGTFSKALGSFGAYVAGSAQMIDYLVNRCAGFIYTTALPPPVLGAIDAALDLLPGLEAARARVAAQAQGLRQALGGLGIDTGPSTTQIVPAILGGEQATLALAASLRRQGLLAVAIRPPTVPPGTSRIRLALSAAHRDSDIDRLITAVAAGLRQGAA